MKDLYEILGIGKDASTDEIKREYKKKALRSHPDRGGNDVAMQSLNEAYAILSDKDKRSRYDSDWQVFQEIDLDETRVTAVDGYLGAGHALSFSHVYRTEHNALRQHYFTTYRRSASAEIYLPNTLKKSIHIFHSAIYPCNFPDGNSEIYDDIFELIEAKTRYLARQELPEPEFKPGKLNSLLAIQLFKKFLAGVYYGSRLAAVQSYFTFECIRLKEQDPDAAEMAFYEGILAIINIKSGCTGDDLLSAITKIIDFAKTADELLLSQLAPLFYDKYFRNLHAFALHLYWSSNENPFESDSYDGRLGFKDYFETLKERMVNESGKDSFSKLLKYVKLLYTFETDLQKTRDAKPTAMDYRESAFHLLDWIPALQTQTDGAILVNTFLQIGIKFQQAAREEIRRPSRKKADEKLALKMYLLAVGIAHHKTPDLMIYVNTLVIKYILNLEFHDPLLTEVLSSLKKSTLVLVDVFPFFTKPQTNVNLLRSENESLPLMRKLLQSMIEIHEYNKTHSDGIQLEHQPSTILYQAYEASLKNWYQDKHDPELEERFRQELMDELLFDQGWTFLDVEQRVDSEWIMVARDMEGWLQPTRELPYPQDPSYIKYRAINGAEINHETGAIHFFMTPWTQDRPVYEKLFSLEDLQEMLERKITGAIFSLDAIDPEKPYHPFNQMRFEPKQLCNSEFLNTLLLTDYILKFLTTNREVQGEYPFEQRPVTSMIQHLPRYLRKIIKKFHKADHTGAIHRFWIEAENIDISLSDRDEQKLTKITLGELKMVVKKHRMERDIHGELKDVSNDDEGWPIHVFNERQFNKLLNRRFDLEGHAMIFIHGTRKLYYWENHSLLKAHTVVDLREPLIRLFIQPKGELGLVKPVTENKRLLYRLTTEMAKQTGLSHRYSAEFIFAHEFTVHYDEFAQFLPEFGRLKELCRMSALIRFLSGLRKSNKQEITALDALIYTSQSFFDPTPDTEAWQLYEKSQQEICDRVFSTFKKWQRELSTAVLKNKWQIQLNKIFGQINGFDSDQYSNYRSQVYELFHTQLESTTASTSYNRYVDDFMRGNIHPLADALTRSEQSKLCQEIQKQLPASSLTDLARALDDDNAIKPVALQEANRQLKVQMASKEKLERGFVEIGLARDKRDISLNGHCFWVPATVRHETPKEDTQRKNRHSFFVYGGVSAQPRINVNRGGGNPGGSRLGGNAFNRINTTKGFQNHHIISPTNPATKNHPLLRLAGFNSQKSIDSRPNRIYLPNPHKASHPERATHCGKHTQMAMNKVAKKMDGILEKGQAQNWNQSQYRSALRSMLANERQQLRKGSVNLYEKPDVPRKSK